MVSFVWSRLQKHQQRAGVGMQHVSLCPSFTGGSGRSPAQPLRFSRLLGLPVLRNQLASLRPCR